MIWTEVLTGVADAIKGIQQPIERLSNRLYRWHYLLRGHVEMRRGPF